ncbi:glycosyltransferase family 2 protein [Altibacter sp. HG106]|uniref:glycosyltransferase family 2 protein n=1 Tax=Altibacter sp. HG106 TaxID=3023937 RepID=UPI002350BCC5|nr:glycosyltransferase family 2 protein [Altibacter sp. HG106]MDC7994014.1 glycosyltransferase family 2 protein [Altibacter sp. HG106]
MKLSVVILNYNVRYFLEQCLRSVERAIYGLDAEIIVVDNNSSDDSCEMVQRVFPEVVLLQNKENIGFSKANNQAVKVAKGQYLCILNPDTAVAEDTFVRCLDAAEQTANIGIIGVQYMDGTGAFLPECKRNVPTPKSALMKLLGKNSSYYATQIAPDAVGNVTVLAGAFMFMKHSVFTEVGGFDPDYFMYGEDIDLSYRVVKAGYQNYYLGTTTLLHYKGESTQKDEAYYNSFYGAMRLFYKKNYNTNVLSRSVVNTATALAKKMSKKQRSVTSLPAPPSEAILLTENLSVLNRLSQVLEIPLHAASKTIFQDMDHAQKLFVFDANYMSYSQIFSVMKQLKGRGNQFRILPKKSDFILGSDRSDDRGAVTVF